jgi:diaminopimelate decarboxylase
MEYFTYREGSLHAENVSLAAIAKKVGGAFMCFSTGAIEHGYRRYTELFKNSMQLQIPVAACQNAAVFSLLNHLGAGFDCQSEVELRAAQAAGVKPLRLSYSGLGRMQADTVYAIKSGVKAIYLESLCELDMLLAAANECKQETRVIIRVDLDIEGRTMKKMQAVGLDYKCAIKWGKIREVYGKLSACRYIKVIGLATFIGAQKYDLIPFQLACKRLATLVEMLKNDGAPIEAIDFGGGMSYCDTPANPEQGQAYIDTLERSFAHSACAIWLRPSHLLLQATAVLVTQVRLVHRNPMHNVVVIGTPLHQHLFYELQDINHNALTLIEPKKPLSKERYDVLGTSSNFAVPVTRKVILSRVQSGDWVVLTDVGTYALTSLNPSLSPLPAVVIVKGNQHHIIRNQGAGEGFAGETLPPWM